MYVRYPACYQEIGEIRVMLHLFSSSSAILSCFGIDFWGKRYVFSALYMSLTMSLKQLFWCYYWFWQYFAQVTYVHEWWKNLILRILWWTREIRVYSSDGVFITVLTVTVFAVYGRLCRSLLDSPTCWFTHSPTRWHTYPRTDSLTYPLTDLITHLLVQPFAHSLTHSCTH